MAHQRDSIIYDGDNPGSPAEGEHWYDGTAKRAKIQTDSAAESLAHLGEFQNHKARHIRGGDDELDGDQLDIDFSPSNYTPSTAPTQVDNAEHLTAHLAGIDAKLAIANSMLQHKAGSVLAASFAGNPKTATVTFGTAFADANYAVTVTAVTSGRKFSPNVANQAAGSFDIDMGANNITDLTQVNWIAVKHGETSTS